MKVNLVFATVLLVLASSSASFGAVLRTTAGVEYSGELATDVLRIRTGTEEIEIPKTAILQAKRADKGFEFLLADGSKLLGVISEESVRLKVGLVVQVVPTGEIEVLMLTPPGFPLGCLESAYYPADKYRGRDPVVGCPIRFQFDVTSALRAKERAPWPVPKPRYFTCDSLSIAAMDMTVDRGKKIVEVDFEGVISVLESFDKWASVTIELSAAGKGFAKGQKGKIDAEERKNTRFRLPLQVPLHEFDAAVASGEPIVARVTVEVTRNGGIE